jgi:hypothetical protein
MVGGVVQAKFPEFDGIGPDSGWQEHRRTPTTAGGDDGNDERDNRMVVAVRRVAIPSDRRK